MNQTRLFCLASGSPRRQELMAQYGLAYTAHPVDADESPLPGESPAPYVARVAAAKAQAARPAFPDHVILAGDTVVVLGEAMLGKPPDGAAAEAMLSALSGRRHHVLSAYHLLDSASGEAVAGMEQTEVVFRELTPEWIAWYSAREESRDKAGAYAIQGVGGAMVERIAGSYTTVVGFPMEAILWHLLAKGWVTL